MPEYLIAITVISFAFFLVGCTIAILRMAFD